MYDREDQGDIALLLDHMPDVQQREADYGVGLVVMNCMSAVDLKATHRRSRSAYVEIKHVAALVVVVMIEGYACDRDGHRCRSSDRFLCVGAHTMQAGSWL